MINLWRMVGHHGFRLVRNRKHRVIMGSDLPQEIAGRHAPWGPVF